MPFTVIIANSVTELQAVLAAVGGVTSKVAPVVTSPAPAAAAQPVSEAAPARRVGRPRKVEAAPAVVAPEVEPTDAEEAAAAVEAPVAAAPATSEVKAPAEQRKSRTRNPHPSPFLWGNHIIDNRNNVQLLEALLAVAPSASGAEKVLRLNKITGDIENPSAKSLFYADTKRLIELGIIARVDAGREFVVKLTKGARGKLVREAAGGSNAEASADVDAAASTDVSAEVATEVSASVSAEAEVITADSALDGAEA